MYFQMKLANHAVVVFACSLILLMYVPSFHAEQELIHPTVASLFLSVKYVLFSNFSQ